MAFDYDGTHDLETSLQDSFGEAILHGVVVSNLASFVAREMALPEEQCHNLAIAGMLHDIGKLRLRSYVYEEKEAKLNIDELRYVRLHPSLGYAILKEHGYTKEILTAVLSQTIQQDRHSRDRRSQSSCRRLSRQRVLLITLILRTKYNITERADTLKLSVPALFCAYT